MGKGVGREDYGGGGAELERGYGKGDRKWDRMATELSDGRSMGYLFLVFRGEVDSMVWCGKWMRGVD